MRRRNEIKASQMPRNRSFGFSMTTFFSNRIVCERLWNAIESDRQLGGVNAMIVNQRYQPPGFISRTMFTLMHGRREKSFAGKLIGPAINLLPEDRDDLPEVVPVEWLNTTCTIYRREALPDPAFDVFFYWLLADGGRDVVTARCTTWLEVGQCTHCANFS